MTDSDPHRPADSAGLYVNDQKTVGGSADELHDALDAPGTPHETDTGFSIAVDDVAGAFIATADGVEFGAVPFLEKDGRFVLLATSVLPEYRGRGLAAALIRKVLDRIRAEGGRVTVRCPVFHSFIERNPEYEALLDPKDPGMVRRSDV